MVYIVQKTYIQSYKVNSPFSSESNTHTLLHHENIRESMQTHRSSVTRLANALAHTHTNSSGISRIIRSSHSHSGLARSCALYIYTLYTPSKSYEVYI